MQIPSFDSKKVLILELDAMRKDVESMKSQAKSVSTEYDRLLSEHEKLQKIVDGQSNKDD